MKRRKRYHSILWKILSVLIVSMIACILAFSGYFYTSMREDAISRYEQQSKSAFRISSQNIDHYLSTCIAAARSIYVDSELQSNLTTPQPRPLTAAERTGIFNYLRAICYSSSAARQIYLAAPQLGLSFLYVPDSLQDSFAALRDVGSLLPELTSYRDIVVQSTHSISTYGHVIGFRNPGLAQEPVFTLWLPVCNLPADSKPMAYLAIDLPASFLVDNCQLAYSDNETVYILDEEGTVVASSDTAWIGSSDPTGSTADQWNQGDIGRISGDQLILRQEMDSQYFNWVLVKTVPLSNIYDTTWKQTMVFLVIFILGLAVVTGINVIWILRYMRPLQRMTDDMDRLVQSHSWSRHMQLPACLDYHGEDEVGVLVRTFGTMLESMHAFTIRQYELELANTRSVLKMLQAQINPHFIYNTIQCFATNALRNRDLEQYRMISSFGQMMHYAMVLDPAIAPLRQEVEYTQRYVALQKMRFANEGELDCQVPQAVGNVSIPKMTIQPLAENAVIHGNLFRVPGGVLRISAQMQEGWLCIQVADNGVPVSDRTAAELREKMEHVRTRLSANAADKPEELNQAVADTIASASVQSSCIGLENVFARLLLNFGDCIFAIMANELGGTTVEYAVPVTLEAQKADGAGCGEEKHESSDCG